jgi:hypothetical protein
MRPTIEREIERRKGEIAPKINAKLAARASDFRFSLTDWATGKWSGWFGAAKNSGR